MCVIGIMRESGKEMIKFHGSYLLALKHLASIWDKSIIRAGCFFDDWEKLYTPCILHSIESIDHEIYECEHPETIDYMEQYYRQWYFEDALDWA